MLLHSRRLDDLAGFFDLALLLLDELLRRPGDYTVPGADQPLVDLGHVGDARRFPVERLHDRGRRLCRCEERVPLLVSSFTLFAGTTG